MTSLIIFIIISLLSYLFSADRKKEKNTTSSPKPKPTASSKGVGDLFGELKKKMEQAERELQQPTPTVQKQKRAVERRVEEKKQQVVTAEKQVVQARKNLQVDKTEKQQKAAETPRVSHPLFSNSDDVRRAVLVAEILGPPKAKRK